jgi:hypothetical protein
MNSALADEGCFLLQTGIFPQAVKSRALIAKQSFSAACSRFFTNSDNH